MHHAGGDQSSMMTWYKSSLYSSYLYKGIFLVVISVKEPWNARVYVNSFKVQLN